MLSRLETPRPLPPAKARKSAAAMQKMSSSPPPAYGSPFTFPARRQMRQDILGSPMATTFQMVGWDQMGDENPSERTADDAAWMNEKSREELKDLLLKADVLIKERENELGITSAVCKGLFQNNVALKSKHEALLARIPTSPSRSISSPGNLDYHTLPPEDSTVFTSSSSESAVDLIRSPAPISYRRHARKVSIAVADVSMLSDQNAELLDKLERLEKEATAADQAGRRELKRLEKEITFLREALEKTQARSDELEEKVQDAVVSQAWRRKKEREAKFRAMRNMGRGSSSNSSEDYQSKVQSFAPEGSTFGGPSETFSFFPTAESPDPNRHQLLDDTSTTTDTDSKLNSLKPHEHALISQLLVKVQELEEANARILQQQSDTAAQLSAVQRDTAHMTRVYDCLSDPDSIELELAEANGWGEPAEEDQRDTLEVDSATGKTVHFRSLKRTLADEVEALRGTCIVRPEFTTSGKSRKTVMGLFDVDVPPPLTRDADAESDHSSEDNPPSPLFAAESWAEDGSPSGWSPGAGAGAMDAPETASARLSPLHFFSPPTQILAELSPLGARATLQSELAHELGSTWGSVHARTASLGDLSQLSVPPSPSPTSRATSRRGSDELDYAVLRGSNAGSQVESDGQGQLHTPRRRSASLLMPANSLQLSVEPPTPERRRLRQLQTNFAFGEPSGPTSTPPRSPRVRRIADALRARSNRWVDRRLQHRSRERSLERAGLGRGDDAHGGSAAAPRAIPHRLMTAVDNMIGGFDSAVGARAADYDSDAGAYSPPAAGSDDDDEDEEREVYSTPRAYIRRRPSRIAYNGGTEDIDNEDLDAFDSPDADAHTGRETQMQLHGGASAESRAGAAEYERQSFLLKVWLWVQFAIVVFVFLYAMARRGPTTVLVDEDKNRRAVARRR